MKRVRRFVCRIVGHTAPLATAGIFQGIYVRADICKRCRHVFQSEVGSRQLRRARSRGAVR